MADLTKSDDVKRLVNSTIEEFGQLDVLVNNAGTGSFNSIRDAKVLEDFDFAFNVNVRAIVELIHRSIPYLEKSKGTIINISSLASLHPVYTDNFNILVINIILILNLTCDVRVEDTSYDE